MAKKEGKLIANNKKAYHDYFILEKYEAGIVLHGTEVKSLRMGQCSIKEAFIRIENGEMFIYGMHVSPYEKGNIFKMCIRDRSYQREWETTVKDALISIDGQPVSYTHLDVYKRQEQNLFAAETGLVFRADRFLLCIKKGKRCG